MNGRTYVKQAYENLCVWLETDAARRLFKVVLRHASSNEATSYPPLDLLQGRSSYTQLIADIRERLPAPSADLLIDAAQSLKPSKSSETFILLQFGLPLRGAS